MSNTHEAQSEMTKQDTLPPLEQERAKFEVWVKAERGSPWPMALDRADAGNYLYLPAAEAWAVWQAALAARAPQTAPESWGDRLRKHDDDLRYVRRVLESGRAMTDPDSRAAIEIIHGLRVIARARPAPQAAPQAQGVAPSMVQNLKDALEGEFNGLSITDDHAREILEYVRTGRPKVSPIPSARCDKPGCNCASWLDEGCAWDGAAPQAPPAPEVPSSNFVQPVPDHCDRITWRGHYMHLKAPAPQALTEREPISCPRCGHHFTDELTQRIDGIGASAGGEG